MILCQNCGIDISYKKKPRYFCSVRCSLLWRNYNNNPSVKGNHPHTPESRMKISKKLKGYKHSEQSRRNMSLAHLGKSNKGYKTGKPAWNRGIPHTEETKQKIRLTREAKGLNVGKFECGNGHPLTEPQHKLLEKLKDAGWIAECAISLGKRTVGFPTNYKVDLGNRQRKLAIEIDGDKHQLSTLKAKDLKKDLKLTELGWTIIRINNHTALDLVKLDNAVLYAHFMRLFDAIQN